MKQFISILFIILPVYLQAQNNLQDETKDYPKFFFRNPLAIPIFLAGNFGECRPGHYHSGLDIKTKGEENQPVYAAADGYVSRIKMEKGGYGHAIYLTHPNGYTTLYAHLNNFIPEIQKYVHLQQYAQKRWDVDLSFSSTDFVISKGQQIAWSGNTGGSTAPHLHFEIRNTATEHPLNPQLFGFQIEDNIPPKVAEVVLYSGNIYEDSIVTIPVEIKEGIYKPAKNITNNFNMIEDTIEVWNSLTGIGINADDYMDGSDNTLAPYLIKLYMDGNIQSQITLNDIGYEQTRYINSYADYKTHTMCHKWVQCLFRLPGNELEKIYQNMNSNNGYLNLTDKKVHKITIEIIDDKNNKSEVVFYVKPIKKFTPVAVPQDAIRFYANQPNNFSNPNVAFILDSRQLYNDIYFRFSKTEDDQSISDHYNLHYSYIPIHHYFELRIKPNKPVPFELRNKVVLKYKDFEDEEEGKAATFAEKGWYQAKVRNFGTYWLAIDTIPPVITLLQKTSNFSKYPQITLEVKDSMTSIKSYSGYIDGKWVCFEQHGNLFFYKFDEQCKKGGKHKLAFSAEDENGNKQTLQLNFTN